MQPGGDLILKMMWDRGKALPTVPQLLGFGEGCLPYICCLGDGSTGFGGPSEGVECIAFVGPGIEKVGI